MVTFEIPKLLARNSEPLEILMGIVTSSFDEILGQAIKNVLDEL